jgi:ectoine hydroxylase-related dioxygenase (phytanoyl-CoA dioxygenase family)
LPADRPDHGVPEKLLVGTAGSVIVLNSHLWHSGTSNRTGRTRRVIQAYFVRRHCKPQLDQADFVTPQTLEALSEPAKALLFLPTEAKPQADLTEHGQAFRA